MSTAPIQLTKLTKDYGNLRAVNEVSFEMRKGEIFGLLGPNGAGKTSIISILVTLEKATSGTARIFGYDVSENPREVKNRTGFVPQELIHHGYFDVQEIMQFHSGYYGRLKNGPRIEYLLQRLGLYEHRHKKVKQLSGGMKRRLLIAKALVHEPQLLLLDEPTAGVDIELRTSLWTFVEELKAQGMSILLTTHYLQEAEQLCDRVGILQKGELKLVGETKGLIKQLTQREIILTLRDSRAAISHPQLLRQKENQYFFQVPSSVVVGDLLAALNLDLRQVQDVQIREGNLEDALKRVLSGKSENGSSGEVGV